MAGPSVSEPEVQLWLTETNALLEHFEDSDRPGASYIIESIDEYVQHLDLIRQEIV